jgi:hypothetical protein
MAYITAGEVKEIRTELKRVFPKYKFKVNKSSGSCSSVSVSVMAGPADFTEIFVQNANKAHAQINHYHLYQYGKFQKFFETINKIIRTAPGKAVGGREFYDNSDAMTDYFDTAFYYNINVGTWSQPYVQKV